MKSTFLLLVVVFFGACNKSGEPLYVDITDEVINRNYIGNGVQWDAYPEAEHWGSAVSEEDWSKLYKRLDFMKPNYVRCMINSPFRYYDSKTGKYDKERNIESLAKVLQYCQDNDITVLFGEYNPPKWEMKDDDEWINMAADYLNYLVNDLGFTCIKYYNLFNEPDGDWASTNGDFYLWQKMLYKFHERMKEYPGLSDKVKIAGPDIVVDYNNPASPYKSYQWVDQVADQMDSIVGIYDIHAYPGQYQVRSGNFSEVIQRYRENVPTDKQIIFGEVGYKYWREEDSLLMSEYSRRAEEHPFTEGTDSNMFVFDYFYGLDMPLLAMEVMNNGYSAVAAWMLDDAMHSQNDAGNIYDIKLWGMWNILGEEVFNKPEYEEMRPWFYSWSLMCRYFPKGTNVLNVKHDKTEGIRVVAGLCKGSLTVAVVNFSEDDVKMNLNLPFSITNGKVYLYQEEDLKVDESGFPMPIKAGINIQSDFILDIPKQSFALLTSIEY